MCFFLELGNLLEYSQYIGMVVVGVLQWNCPWGSLKRVSP